MSGAHRHAARRAGPAPRWAAVLAAALAAAAAVGPAPARGAAVASSPGPPADDFLIIDRSAGLSLHEEMYFLPFTHADRYRGRQSEVVFQISGKQALWRRSLYCSFTQLSYWQAYNVQESAPFRNSDYRPEVFYRWEPRDLGGGRAGLDAGFVHESNGQRSVMSRSWNQIYLAPHWRRQGLLLRAKIRWRLPEDVKTDPESAEGDDNPGINDYLGHADLHVYYRWRTSHQVHVLVRGNPATGRGFISVNLSRALPRGQDAWVVLTASHGYGESLLDYDRKVTRVGFGFMLAR